MCKNISLKDRLLAIATIIISYLIVKFAMFDTSGFIGATVFSLLIIFTIVIQLVSKIKFDIHGITLYAINIFLSLSLLLYDNEALNTLTVLLLFVMIPYTIYFSYIKSTGKDTTYFFEVVKAIFVIPFMNFTTIFKHIFSGKKKSGQLGKALLGIAISVPVTIIIAILLLSDIAFENMFNSIFTDFFDKLLSLIIHLIFAVPLSCAIYSSIISAKTNSCAEILKEDACLSICNKIRIIPQVTSIFFVFPILLIYILFFISQSAYFLSGFNGILPNDFTYSEYARSGFYELCAVSVINFILITGISIFGKRNNKKYCAGNVISIILSIVTIILISIAASKMFLYISEYGLTRLRVTTLWIMSLLLLLFIAVIIKQFSISFKLFKTGISIFLIMFTILTHINMDSMIAKYNIENYINGNLKELDIAMLTSLDDGATKHIIKLKDSNDKLIKEEIELYLEYATEFVDDYSLIYSNLQEYNAIKELEKIK